MSLNAAPSRARSTRPRHAQDDAPWDIDPALLPQLRAIVADAAAVVKGARIVVASRDGRPRVLLGAHGNGFSWRTIATAVIERGEAARDEVTIGAPIHGVTGLRATLLLHHDRVLAGRDGTSLARAYAARVETVVASSITRIAATRGAVDALLQALAAHDKETARHAHAVRRLARTLGAALDLAPHALLELEWAALLHDMGKTAVPPELLRKPEPLADAEWAIVKQHPSVGERIVRAVPALDRVGLCVRHHHERWDGSGYPDRLAGRAIPLHARIIALVDAYETMRAGRPYRAPQGYEEAAQDLRCHAGTQFDPDLVPWLPILDGYDLDLL